MPKLTDGDLSSLRVTMRKRIQDNCRPESDEDYDEGGPEPCMTSVGYVELWMDGLIVANGVQIAHLESGLE